MYVFVSVCMCYVDIMTNAPSWMQMVEASFSPEPTLRKAERQIFCLGSPKRTQNWLSQFFVESKDSNAITLKLGVGRYKIMTPSMARPFFVDVEEDAQYDSANITLEKSGDRIMFTSSKQEDIYDNMSGAMENAASPQRVVLTPGSVTINIENADSKRHRVQLAYRSVASLVRCLDNYVWICLMNARMHLIK
jgi:hypothetical protein